MLKNSFVILMAVAVFFSVTDAHSEDLKVVVFDVGMGQSVLLERDGHGLLIDTGLAEYSPLVLSRLNYYGVQTLDYLVLSHLHPDHAAGYFQIREAWPDTPVLGSCHLPETLHPEEEDFFWNIHTALSVDSLYSCLAAGDTLSWQGSEIRVLWAVADQKKNLNHNSLVLLLKTPQGGSLLVMGDVDRAVEKRLTPVLQALLPPSGIPLYVAAHHASALSTDPEFLSVLRPQVSMVSVGQNNTFRYPSDTSLEILDKYSRTVLRTDKDGEICYVLGSTTTKPCKERE